MAGATEELGDLVDCSICLEIFTDPRALPCLHTFCLHCLQNHCTKSQPGYKKNCPLCKQDFTIPRGGVAGIQKNFFVEKLVQAKKASLEKATSKPPCDACIMAKNNQIYMNMNEPQPAVSLATMYCIYCQQNLCDHCSQSHRNMKDSAQHTQIQVGVLAGSPAARCKQHESEVVTVYCHKCKLAICMTCCITSHKTHKYSGIAEAARDQLIRAQNDTEKVAGYRRMMTNISCRVDKHKNLFASHINDVRKEVSAAAASKIAVSEAEASLITEIQRHEEEVLLELDLVELERVDQIEEVKRDVGEHATKFKSFEHYRETLVSSETACGVIQAANSLHDRVKELELETDDVIVRVDQLLPPLLVSFAPSSSTSLTDHANLVGAIVTKRARTGLVSHIIPTGKQVCGVVSLKNHVYVVRRGVCDVEVYDAKTFKFQRYITVPGRGEMTYGIAACSEHNCLYVPDRSNIQVHRIELTKGKAVTKWPVTSQPCGLSVTTAHNVLVTCGTTKSTLQEYTTHGELVRTILLDPDIREPWHAVQMSDNRYVVSHQRALHRVSVVSEDGAVVRSFGGPAGSEAAPLNGPRGVTLDGRGNVVVADCRNHRLLLLNKDFSEDRECLLNKELSYPFSLWFDQKRNRLYVGEYGGGRVLVIENFTLPDP